ncbi:jg7721 [Pararge aegeria aegeria]|uniref:Jg7721 protein n=1 Tax=Pararge aegeria aegeria TaxID=348720 RepID=A0A8S4RE44_9NEOP|nr:jg7721 [Pararge aegeria aegeria]
MFKTNMFVVTLFVLVYVVCGKVNSTDVTSSRMAWMKGLLDHHDWMEILDGNHTVPRECESDLRQYITALNEGSLWASKSKY